jgi:hypothetical protein
MGRSGESAGKRRVNAMRSERKAAKTERRQQRPSSTETAEVDEAEVLARFHQLNELRAEGGIPESEYERQRADIYRALGLEDPFAPAEAPPVPESDHQSN